MDEPFGPEYIRPAQKDCPRCSCCTEALCQRGRDSVMRCVGHTGDEARETVSGCPCSAETTRHTAAWRAAQVRVTRMARELPLAPEAEALLREMAKGAHAEDPAGMFPELELRGLGQLVHARPAITPLGHTYLRGRDDIREATAVRVIDIDTKARLARVEVVAWLPGVPVTVLMDQIASESGLDVDSLPGRWLDVEANCGAEDDELVLTAFRASAPLPEDWMSGEGDAS
ncbi:hypothetical protein GCM10010387_16390 [Streptomyces inusitatus]|uniref:Uncharacterized protein n=1 Tax=Streptomyces inusitatus TaxID=68221 RepID=A0A918PW25_9ACTN|nr:hypothetical protein [Streptomyces inusitatus]GGZ23867.1 hypothetical protein GCM10010387_16390 [Streptomyces inusitatus]